MQELTAENAKIAKKKEPMAQKKSPISISNLLPLFYISAVFALFAVASCLSSVFIRGFVFLDRRLQF